MFKLNTNKIFLLIGIAAFTFAATSCDDSTTGVGDEELEVRKAEDIPANADAERGAPADYTFYSLADGEIVADEDSASTQWDLAFSGTTVLTNSGASGPGQGGAVILDIPFEEVETAPSEGYGVDTDSTLAIPTGSENGWYRYTGNSEPKFAILPLPEKTIVVRTAAGNYAKVEILSYYQGNPDTSTEEFNDPATRPPSRFYTFRYVIQTDGSRDLK